MLDFYELFTDKKFSHFVTEICLIASIISLGIERTDILNWISHNIRLYFTFTDCLIKYWLSILPYIIAIAICYLKTLNSLSIYTSSNDLLRLKQLVLKKTIMQDLISKKETARRVNLFLFSIIIFMGVFSLPGSIRVIFINPISAYCQHGLRNGTSSTFTSGIIVILFFTYGGLIIGMISKHLLCKNK